VRCDSAILTGVVERNRLVAQLAKLLTVTLKLRVADAEIRPDEPIFGGRLCLDSVDAAQWVATVERRFGVQIPDEELLSGALESLGALADVLIRHGIEAESIGP
jgi:acyl carrier protein